VLSKTIGRFEKNSVQPGIKSQHRCYIALQANALLIATSIDRASRVASRRWARGKAMPARCARATVESESAIVQLYTGLRPRAGLHR
jgi:hypothetical protein